MDTYKIGVVAGDGIGPEVIAESVKVLEAVAKLDGGFQFDFTHYPWGCKYYLQTGRMMAEDGMGELPKQDAIFLGAVGAPGVPDHISLWDLLLKIRKGFDQYVKRIYMPCWKRKTYRNKIALFSEIATSPL